MSARENETETAKVLLFTQDQPAGEFYAAALEKELYLVGNNDKEIAEAFRCSGAAVHAHWRRMARKAHGADKADVVTDFHRFLAGSDVHPS